MPVKKLTILHIVKTVDGAQWALEQVKVLVSLGHIVHIVLNSRDGKFISQWKSSGAVIHYSNLDFPAAKPFELIKRIKSAKRIIKTISPDIIHSHFFGTTIILRLALRKINIPLIFQVPGPLHLENFFFRKWELLSSGKNDYWIPSSDYIKKLYLNEGISEDHLFKSYYGSDYSLFNNEKDYSFREKASFQKDDFVIGNVSYIYAPKPYLFQKTGLKNHKLLIDSLAHITKINKKMKGLLIGGQWGKSDSYEKSLREYAQKVAGNKISLPGKVQPWQAHKAWNNLDLAVHIPNSENCGGVLEPILSMIPTICSQTGGLPEVIIDGVTGYIIPQKSTESINATITKVYNDYEKSIKLTKTAQKLVLHMFDVRRTAKEVEQIYFKIIGVNQDAPKEFHAINYIKENHL